MNNDKGKGEIERKLEKFVKESFRRFNLGPDDTMNRDNSAILMKELLSKHGQEDAWDEEEFDAIFNLFEEDDPVVSRAANGGLDQSEFTKLVKRIA